MLFIHSSFQIKLCNIFSKKIENRRKTFIIHKKGGKSFNLDMEQEGKDEESTEKASRVYEAREELSLKFILV